MPQATLLPSKATKCCCSTHINEATEVKPAVLDVPQLFADQYRQLLSLINQVPSQSSAKLESIITCFSSIKSDWIIDLGATNYISSLLLNL